MIGKVTPELHSCLPSLRGVLHRSANTKPNSYQIRWQGVVASCLTGSCCQGFIGACGFQVGNCSCSGLPTRLLLIEWRMHQDRWSLNLYPPILSSKADAGETGRFPKDSSRKRYAKLSLVVKDFAALLACLVCGFHRWA